MFHVSTMLPWTPNNRQQVLYFSCSYHSVILYMSTTRTASAVLVVLLVLLYKVRVKVVVVSLTEIRIVVAIVGVGWCRLCR